MSTMECPRCGFQQPADRYCANCGLDVEHYEPTPPPWHEQLLKNSTFHLALAVGLIVGIIYYIYSGYKSQNLDAQNMPMAENVQTLPTDAGSRERKAPAGTQENTQRVRPQAKQRNQINQGSERGTPPPSPSADNKQEFSGSTPTQKAETANTSSTESAPEPSIPSRVNMRFYEVPRDTLLQIFDNGEIITETSNARILLMEDEQQLNGLLAAAHALPGTRSSAITPNKEIVIPFQGSEGRAEPQGMIFQVLPLDLRPGQVELDISGRLYLALQEDQAPSNYSLVDGTFTLPSKGALLLVGLVPHEALPESVESSFLNTPLTIMTSPEFLSSNTEFLVVLKAQ